MIKIAQHWSISSYFTMKSFVLLYAIIQIVWVKCDDTATLRLIEEVNSKNTTWTAGINFPDESPDMFLYPRGEYYYYTPDVDHPVEVVTHDVGQASIPDTFDARDQWSACRGVIDNIRDQGRCASGWAFGPAEVMSDRLCIQTEGRLKFQFSPQELVSCCSTCGWGCQGGAPMLAWTYWEQHGIVSGGDSNSNEGCQPYDQLSNLNTSMLVCRKSCQNNNYQISYNEDKHFGARHYTILPDVKQIQTEILTNGPVQARIQIFEDISVYKEGVYQVVSGNYFGNHTVKIMGWGAENNVPYWLVAISWGTKWGLKGYVRIRRGYNEVSIEENIIAGKAYTGAGRPNGGSVSQHVSSGLGLFLAGLIFLVLFE